MCFHWAASFGFDGVDVRKENRLKKEKRKLSEEDETKEECYRFVDAWEVWEEEWKEFKKNEMTFMILGRGRKKVSRKVLSLQCHHMYIIL